MTAAPDVLVLAGGTGARLGGTDKAGIVVAGRRLVDAVLEATAGAARRVVVGPVTGLPADVLVTTEQPPGGGPAAGVVAGLAALAAAPGEAGPWTLVLATDLVDVTPGLTRLQQLLPTLSPDEDGACLGVAGRPQWLFGAYRTAALRAAARDLGDPTGASMQRLLAPLRLRTIEVEPAQAADIDTPEDLARWAGAAVTPPAPAAQRDGPEGPATRARWQAWTHLAAEAVGVDAGEMDLDRDIATVHRLTKQVAHRYDRPLAPVAAYVLGLAVGAARARGEQPDQAALRRAIEATIEQAPPVPEEGP